MFCDILHDLDLVNDLFFGKGDFAQNWEPEDRSKLLFDFHLITSIECAL